MEKMLKNAKIENVIPDGNGADLTNRLIDTDPNFEYPEWVEYGTIDGIPVAVYYRTTPKDQELVTENGGDWGAIDWDERVDRIEVDLYECDKLDIAESAIDALVKKYN